MQQLLREHRAATVGAAIIIPFLVAAALVPFRDSVTPATDVLVLVAVVVAFSTTGLRSAGLAAALSAAAAFDFFLTEPYQSFAINDANDLEAAALLLVIGGLVTETALWGQRTDAALSREVGYVDGVLATAESVSAEQLGPEEHARLVSLRICEVLDLDSCRFELGGTLDPLVPTLNHDGSITRAGRDCGCEQGWTAGGLGRGPAGPFWWCAARRVRPDGGLARCAPERTAAAGCRSARRPDLRDAQRRPALSPCPAGGSGEPRATQGRLGTFSPARSRPVGLSVWAFSSRRRGGEGEGLSCRRDRRHRALRRRTGRIRAGRGR